MIIFQVLYHLVQNCMVLHIMERAYNYGLDLN